MDFPNKKGRILIMIKTVTEFSIDREALLNSDYESCDRVSFIEGADKSDVDPAEFIDSIIAKLIEREADL